MSEEAIYQILSRLLLAGRLAPGTQLVETQVAKIFGVTRERVRKVLQRLGHERLLELVPNRGAFVSTPSLEGAREIYEARRIVESGIAVNLATHHRHGHIAKLRDHSQREHEALRRGDRAESIRLSGEFHVLLAQATGSAFVVRQVQELVSRTSMLVALFEASSASQCACAEHDEIVEAIVTGDVARAARAMMIHLSLVETRLQVQPSQKISPLEVVLRQALAQAAASRTSSHKSARRTVQTR